MTDLPPLSEAPPMIACPWCWDSDEGVRFLDGKLERHDDIVLGRDCRGSGKTPDDVAKAEAIDRLCCTMLSMTGHPDWTVRWSSAAPSECHWNSKQIWMHDKRGDEPWYYIKEAFIHEVAHIEGTPGVGGEIAHGMQFFHRLGALYQRLAHMIVGPV